MTEEEKRRKALEIFAAVQARLSSWSPLDVHTPALRRMEQRQSILSTLAQKGITWEELKIAYNEELKRGQQEMMGVRLSFFYAASAIVYKEQFPFSAPQDVADFITALQKAPKGAVDSEALMLKCLEQTGFDASIYDTPGTSGPPSRASMPTSQRASRKDQAAIDRMKRSGITEADLDYERQAGYQNGWNSTFYFSACYATLALVLYNEHSYDADQIEEYVSRVIEVCDEEISVADILERAEREAGVDVSELGAMQV